MPSNAKGGEWSKLGMTPVNLLTVNHIPHILEQTIDDLEGLRRGYPSLILSEPIQPPKHRLDILSSKELLLDKRFCIA